GIATYWLPTHALSDRATRAVIRAFCDAFADCSLWNGSGSDLMLMGTRDAAGPVAEERFAAQWRDPAVAPELAALGFERPEQIGALFIGDAEYLRELTRNTAAVRDDRPKRITAPPTSQAALKQLRDELRDTEEARERFRESPLVARLWPERLREASLPYFEWQRVLNIYLWGLRDPRESSIGDVHRILTRSDLRAPARWLLGSDPDQQRILAAATPEMRARPDHQLHLGIRELAERHYAGALPALRAAEAAPGLRRQALGLQIFALAMDGQLEAAQALAQARFAELGEAGRLESFWRWMKQQFGIDPRAVELAAAP
ncbi:MAG TPA: hypothetical protein VIY27_11405, partial [Myxococcota bacterium]